MIKENINSLFDEGADKEKNIVYKMFSRKLKPILDSNEGYDFLDKYELNLWDEGACLILAKALSDYFNYPIFAIYNKTKGHMEHFMVKVGDDLFLDGQGVRNFKEILEDIKEINPNIKEDELILTKNSSKLNSGGIPDNPQAVEELKEFFKANNL